MNSNFEEAKANDEKSYKKVDGQNVVLLSLMTPSSKISYNILKKKIDDETNLQKKCDMLYSLIDETINCNAVKFWGVFKNNEEARHYLDTELKDYKAFHILQAETHEWLVLNETCYNESMDVEDKLAKMLQHNIKDKKFEEDLIQQRIHKESVK